ncbi:iron-sulfur cluster co-chaperone protein HscB isoform X5 [Crotalus tigris]|uniref:iron-sulfur cluster co-chaperone protein HscB isoform X5 n=1 Tax=Crotalus tigris TaxID=88082 RepID=UPI00192F6D1A|nr:iron-sulfur cluster co-chaperone protein HscB isoform X5 [Crotalus tigris]
MWRRTLRAGAPRRAGSQAPGRCYSCWSCGAPLGGAAAGGPGFCPSCRALQPPEARADLFRVLGCPRGFALDLARLRQRFLALQRSLHPDRFSRRSQLELHGVELAAGSDAEAEPAFLAEVLELNEQLAAANSEASLAALERLLAAKQEALLQEVSRAFEQGDLPKAKRLLSKMKYFANLEEKVKEKKAPS